MNHGTRRPAHAKRDRTILALLAAALLCLSACTRDAAITAEAPTETGDGESALTGRVLDNNRQPVPGVIVTLAKTGAADTTDLYGRYSIDKPGGAAGKASAGAVIDTLNFLLNGQKIASLNITGWISLPDFNIIQRDISGALPAVGQTIRKVQAVVSGDGIPAGQPIVAEFFNNSLAHNYSGFIYFPIPDSLRNYSVTVSVYGDSGRLIGRSLAVSFNSNAGDLVIPSFRADNALPTAHAGRDTSLKVHAAFALHGSAVDSFGGAVAKWEWNIGGAGFRRTSSGDTSITLPSARSSAYSCILRVTDNEGNQGMDTLIVRVINENPTLAPSADTVATLEVPATFHVAASDPDGIRRYLWDFDGDGINEDTTAADSVIHVFHGGPRTAALIVTAQDNYDGVTRDTTRVFILSSAPAWAARASGTTSSLRAVAWTGTRFVAVGDTGAILTSPDGISWTPQNSGTTKSIRSIAWSGSKLVALTIGNPASDSVVLTSTDGISWSKALVSPAISSPSFTPAALTWAHGMFVMAGSSPGGSILTSPDGVTWTTAYSKGTPFFSIVWTGSLFVAGGGSGLTLVTSPDGVTWTKLTTTGSTSREYVSMAWTGTQIVNTTGSGLLSFSPDGIAWTDQDETIDLYAQWRALLWTGSQLIAVGTQGLASVSPDQGVHWIHQTVGSKDFLAASSSGSRLVAVGTGGSIYSSP